MTTARVRPIVSMEEYLKTSYGYDVEFVDGEIVERGMPTLQRGLLQKLLVLWFAVFEDEFGFEIIQEVRTQIIERSRYRIPDTMLCPRPVPIGRICDVVPWAIIEVLSPDDTVAETRDRFVDYQQIGVHSLILMDPEKYTAYQFVDGSLIAQPLTKLSLPDCQVKFDTTELFAQLQRRLYPDRPVEQGY